MKSVLIETFIVLQLIANQGIFLHQRKMPIRIQPAEVRSFVRRPGRKGRKCPFTVF